MNSSSSSESSPPAESRKRKRDVKPAEEIEIDVAAPEPPSKKASRKAKKAKTATGDTEITTEKANGLTGEKSEDQSSVKRSEHGIWIGNLPFTATKESLREFFCDKGGIAQASITRIHMPAPKEAASARTLNKPQNKGFAYVDLATASAFKEALELSETLMTGRRVLIKDAKSFEGRPEQPKEGEARATLKTDKAPSRRIFVGNLSFDISKDDLEEHFGQCGTVSNVHMATFEDTGKCKGFAWVEFEELESAESAIQGWIKKPVGDESDNEEDDGETEGQKKKKRSKKEKFRKWWVNKLQGRPLRMEFAEGKDVRYKKRFGSAAKGNPQEQEGGQPDDEVRPMQRAEKFERRNPSEGRSEHRERKRLPPTPHQPGTGNVQVRTGGIVESTGKKTTFD